MDARFIQMLDSSKKPSALLVAYGAKCSKHILDRWKSHSASAPSGVVSTVIADQISRLMSNVIPQALSQGNLFQVIGTPELVKGINNGTHVLMQTSTGTLGTVVTANSGQIAGQLRFGPSHMAGVIAPPLTLSILNAAAGTLHLQRINLQLTKISKQIEKFANRHESEAMGRLFAALKTLDTLNLEYRASGSLSLSSLNRLAIVEQEVGSIYERNKILINQFAERADSVKGVRGKDGADLASSLLSEDGSQAARDMGLMAGLISAQTSIDQLLLSNDIAHQPKFVEQRLRIADQRIESHKLLVQGLPSLESIHEHATQCLAEMNWFQRNIFARSTVSRVRDTAPPGQTVTPLDPSSSVVPSICIWRDEEGLHAKLSNDS